MRIVQVIDSLEVGGAERMAVNYANALSRSVSFSGLVATRAEGKLKTQISEDVGYLFLKRKHTFDFAAALRLKNFCKTNKIDIIQAHSSSYFIAVMVKILHPKIKIIWHDHNGMSEFVDSRKPFITKMASYFFSGIIVVNHKLQEWAQKKLLATQVVYIANFTTEDEYSQPETLLHGAEGKRILCLANLRDQKNHFLLLDVADIIVAAFPEWTFHLVGKDFEDDYSGKIKALIDAKKLDRNVFVYGSKNDTAAIIRQSEIAVLTSKSEGLPVALIEYGLYRKPVVVTAVGEVPDIVQDGINGFLVSPDSAVGFAEALVKLIEDANLRKSFGQALYNTVSEKNSEHTAMDIYMKWIKSLSDE